MSQPTVLIVDDEAPIRESLRRLLMRAGWQPMTAASPSEALEALAATTPDAVVLDVRMPDKTGITSGLQLLALLRRQAPYQQLPVVVLTGHFLSAEEDALVRRCRATVLYKPSDLSSIVAVLADLRRETPEVDRAAR